MTYTIKKGKHSCFHLPKVHSGRATSRTYLISFSQSCWYSPELDWERDWNKVVGWTTALFPYLPKEGDTHYKGSPHKWYRLSDWEPSHHYNSIRLASRAGGTKADPTLELALYTYQDGKLIITPVGTTYGYGEDLQVTLTNQGSLGVVVGYSNFTHQDTASGVGTIPNGPGWILFPYVGGNNVAIEDSHITVERLLPTSWLNSLGNYLTRKFNL